MEERCGRSIESIAEGNDSSNVNRATDIDLLQQALDERERFLKRNPRLRSYQAEIERLLDNAGNSQGRMAVLGTLMQGKLLELQKQLCSLTEILVNNTNSR